MNATLVRIGNSRGVRLPKAFIEAAHLENDLDLELRGDEVVIKAKRITREGWAVAAEECTQNDDDVFSDWDTTVSDFGGRWE